ncbi:MAG TPA: hypothetical protein PLG60_06595, partial [Acidimicrobiales bacterium]|nr:hypothetical protein [Acidimicrobiales bacterium]
MTRQRVLVVGDVMLDVVVRPRGALEPTSDTASEVRVSRGGSAATLAVTLARHGLDGEFGLNIEANHATLAGHSFHHEVAYAAANGMLGSIDANRGDAQNGWDTDQFP